MDRRENTQEFLSYIKTPLSKSSLNVLYSANNIKFERCQLFGDFIESLIVKIVDTYMGDDITKPSQRVKHFKWCWDKTIEEFQMEGINFKSNHEIYNYFKGFMVDSYYSTNDKGDVEGSKINLTKIWKYIFDYNTNKTRSDVEIFIDVYKMFEKTL